jgi:hypothetical protein
MLEVILPAILPTLTLVSGAWAALETMKVLRRLELGGSRQVGRRIATLSGLLILTVGFAYFAFGSAARTYLSTWVSVENAADFSYIAAGIVLLAGGALWAAVRRVEAAPPPAADTPPPSRARSGDTLRAPRLLLTVSAVVLTLLWMVQSSIETLVPAGGVAAADVTQFVGTIIGAGLLAMAIVQGVRTLLPVRGLFHRTVVERWVDESLQHASSSTREPRAWRVKVTQRMFKTLMALARGSTAGERYALLDLPIEQLCGQIAAEADRLLDNPAALLHRRERPDRHPVQQGASPMQPATESRSSGDEMQRSTLESSREMILAMCVLAAGRADVRRFLADARKIAAAPDGQLPPEASRRYVQLRANLSQRIQRNIDRLQIQTSFWWKRALRGLAFAICGVLGLAMFKNVFPAVVCAVVGGFVATAARDLIAVVEKARR